MATPEDVERAIAASYVESSRLDVQAALSLYTDREVSRVQLAILCLPRAIRVECLSWWRLPARTTAIFCIGPSTQRNLPADG